MQLILTNLAGLWALLGVPVILLIHFLQKERREVVSSTLFLLGDMQRESKSGIRLERLRNSLPLWLQILAVLLLTWLLTGPRWMREDSFQRVVVVLDSSASMTAFYEESVAAIDRHSERLARATAHQEWILLETDATRGTLYSGESREEMLAALAAWKPRSGTHDVAPALEQASSLLRREGSVLFVTSRMYSNIPATTQVLAVGSPIPNVGFTGFQFDRDESDGEITWQALVRNHSQSVQSRTWHAGFGGRTLEPESIRLEPGQTLALRGRFPVNEREGFLVMDDDRFGLDDWAPLVRPEPKPLTVFVEDHPVLADFAEPFLRSLSAWSRGSADGADFRIATRLRNQVQLARPGIYFLVETEPPEALLTAPVVAENHPLMRELNWQGLLVQTHGPVPLLEEDRVLLWQGEVPLIVLRQTGGERRLFLNFDLRYSNAGRLPAFVVLLHRFVDRMRETKPVFEQRNLQTAQVYSVAADPLGGEITIRFRARDGEVLEERVAPHQAGRLVAPGDPGFLEVNQGAQPLLRAGVHFADAREADFADARSREPDTRTTAALLKRSVADDFLTPLWLLTLGGVLVLSWWLTGRRQVEG